MAHHVLVVMTDPVEGEHDSYNTWYNEVHLRDVLEIPGFVSARRFEASAPVPERAVAPRQYMVIYEIEADDVNAVLEELYRRRPSMEFTSSLDQSRIAASAFTQIV